MGEPVPTELRSPRGVYGGDGLEPILEEWVEFTES